jgi:prepilin-type N-terminal cleavage/methylation domain-containing protein
MMNLRKKHSGYTLVELLIVAAIIGIAATALLKQAQNKFVLDMASSTSSKVQRVQRAAMRHHLATSSWPADANVLVTANRLTAAEATDPFGNAYAFTVIGDDFSMSIETSDALFAAKMRPMLPRSTLAGTVLTTVIDGTGSEAAHSALYVLNGSKPLTGDMDAGGFDIGNVNDVTASGVISSNFLTASTSVSAPRFADADDPTFGLDPASTSRVNNLNVVGSIVTSEITDLDDTNYFVNPNGNSILASIAAEKLFISGPAKANNTLCDPLVDGHLARTAGGQFLNCNDITGRWAVLESAGDALNEYSGYTDLPNGTTFQWGSAWVNRDSTARVTLPKSFNTRCLSTTVGVKTANAASNWDAQELSVTGRCWNSNSVELRNFENSFTEISYWVVGH